VGSAPSLLSRYFGTGAAFWVNLQARYDLALAERDFGAQIAKEVDEAA
jgi:plasmid maintenance system antidote protein VapI